MDFIICFRFWPYEKNNNNFFPKNMSTSMSSLRPVVVCAEQLAGNLRTANVWYWTVWYYGQTRLFRWFGRFNESRARFTKAIGDKPSERRRQPSASSFVVSFCSDDPGGSVKVCYGKTVIVRYRRQKKTLVCRPISTNVCVVSVAQNLPAKRFPSLWSWWSTRPELSAAFLSARPVARTVYASWNTDVFIVHFQNTWKVNVYFF